MPIYTGVNDEGFYDRRQAALHRSMQGLMAAVDAYDRKRRSRAEIELKAGMETPGWFGSNSSKAWRERYGKLFPEMARVYESEVQKKNLASQFMAAYRRRASEGDPYALRGAFQEAAPDDIPYLMEWMADHKIKPEDYLQDTLEYNEVSNKFAPFMASRLTPSLFGRGFQPDSETLGKVAGIEAGLVASPGQLEEQAAKARHDRELEALRHTGDMQEIAARAAAEKPGVTLSREKWTKENIVDELLSVIPTPEVTRDSGPSYGGDDVSELSVKRAAQALESNKRWANGLAVKLMRLREAGQEIQPGDIAARVTAAIEDGMSVAAALRAAEAAVNRALAAARSSNARSSK